MALGSGLRAFSGEGSHRVMVVYARHANNRRNGERNGALVAASGAGGLRPLAPGVRWSTEPRAGKGDLHLDQGKKRAAN